MNTRADGYHPYRFGVQDLETARLMRGVDHTLKNFHRWRDDNPDLVAGHIDLYTQHLRAITADLPSGRFRRTSPSRRKRFQDLQIAREIAFFGVYNLGEIIAPNVSNKARIEIGDAGKIIDDTARKIHKSNDSVAAVVAVLRHQFPVLEKVSEVKWLGEQIYRLYRILPEAVIQSGGMGKVVRIISGVLAIGAYDTFDDISATRTAHMTRILPAAYAYGATYSIIDDTLQDMPGEYISKQDKERYHQTILQVLRSGHLADTTGFPDHPLTEELHRIYEKCVTSYPFLEYRHLYHAAEAMHLAQHRDAHKNAHDTMAHGLTGLYPDIFAKASLSRVVANILGRRKLDDDFYANCINTTFISQFRDDLYDREEDAGAGRLTLFTCPAGDRDTNPLYDLFAYEAYVAHNVYGHEPDVAHILSYFGATKLASHLSSHPRHAAALTREYRLTSEMVQFFSLATALPRHITHTLRTVDRKIEKDFGRILGHREQTVVDPRTFVSDRLAYINEVIHKFGSKMTGCGLDDIIDYSLGGSGKRLRPALTLMLAEGLDIDYTSIEPLLAAIELFHTSSLMFDDLPAQDDSRLRRGKPTAHTVFHEGHVQLAAISMMSLGFGMIAELSRHYPAQRVADVIAYAGSTLGARVCRGQYLDLQAHLTRENTAGAATLETYSLKTSTAIEAALVPLMMLTDRAADEIDTIKRYSYHAGIVFQLRDDMLEVMSTREHLGKDVASVGEPAVNIVRRCGLDDTERLMQTRLDAAIRCCNTLPFNADLLQGVVRHFAGRSR